MNFVFWYFVIGLYVAGIREWFVAADWGGLYKPTVASLMVSTILWPVVAYKTIQEVFN